MHNNLYTQAVDGIKAPEEAVNRAVYAAKNSVKTKSALNWLIRYLCCIWRY